MFWHQRCGITQYSILVFSFSLPSQRKRKQKKGNHNRNPSVFIGLFILIHINASHWLNSVIGSLKCHTDRGRPSRTLIIVQFASEVGIEEIPL